MSSFALTRAERGRTPPAGSVRLALIIAATGLTIVAAAGLAIVMSAVLGRPAMRRASTAAAASTQHAAARPADWWTALPGAARGPISATLGRMQPAYRVTGAAAANPAQRLQLRFLSHGAVALGTGGGHTLLRLAAIGRGKDLLGVALGAADSHANRVSYASRSVREWFTNGPIGLEQSFTVVRRPAGTQQPLVVDIGLTAGTGVALPSRQTALLKLPGGSSLRYSGLSAVDAHGRRLAAHLALTPADGLRIVIDDAHASYPITVDPFIQDGGLIDPDATAHGTFGASVAVSGDGSTAIIGSPGDGSDEGGAWVFTDDGGTWTQQGPELVGDCTTSCTNEGTEESTDGLFGWSVALSDDGDTALIGAPSNDPDDTGADGAAWIFTRTGSSWIEQTAIGAGNVGASDGSRFGYSVALSSDGTTALIGAPNNASGVGAAWALPEADNNWLKNRHELTGTCADTCSDVGSSVALDAGGTVALLGAPDDNSDAGGALVFTQTSDVWSQQGAELVGNCASSCTNEGTGESGAGEFGFSVALSGPGTTALVGAIQDGGGAGAVWTFAGNGTTWTQSGSKLVGNCTSSCTHQGTGEAGDGELGSSISLSTTAATAAIGAADDNNTGATWVFTGSAGTWTQSGTKLVGDCTSSCANQGTGEVGSAGFGFAAGLSGDGTELLVGGPDNGSSSSQLGAVWAFGPQAVPPPKATTTVLSSSPNGNTEPAQSVTFTATVTPTPDGGTVAFTDNGQTVSSCANVTLTNGVANCTIDFSAGGDYGLVATYSGDSAYASSYGDNNHEVALIQTSTDLTSVPGQPQTTRPVVYTATTTPEPVGGTFDFTINGTTISGCGAVPVSQGYARCTTVAPAVGTAEAVVVTYSGSTDYAGSASSTLSQTVTKIPTSTSVTTSVSAIGLGQAFMVAVTVSPTPDGGTINFRTYDQTLVDGGTPGPTYSFTGCGAVPLVDGTASCRVQLTTADQWLMFPTYSGDATYDGSDNGYAYVTAEPVGLDLDVTAPGGTASPSATTTVAECGHVDLTVAANHQTVSGDSALTVSGTGSTSDFSTHLASSTLHKNGSTTLKIDAGCGGTGTATYTVSAQPKSGYAPATATVTVSSYLAVKSIDVESNPGPGADAYGRAMIPMLGQQGSEVKINLPSLPAGTLVSTVEFGNRVATVNPIIQDPSAAWVKARVPMYATSGTVTVTTNHGDYLLPNYQLDSFRNTWGLPYVNVGGLPPVADIDGQAALDLFGASKVYYQGAGAIFTAGVAEWLNNDRSVLGGQGACYGDASLLQWLYSLSPSARKAEIVSLPNLGSTPFDLTGFGGPSNSLSFLVTVFHIEQFDAQENTYTAAETDESSSIPAQRTVDELKQYWHATTTSGAGALGGAKLDIPTITLFNQGTGGGGHMVIPYAIQPYGSGGYAIYVWNPNSPYTSAEAADLTGNAAVTAVDADRIIVASNGSWKFNQFSPEWHGDKYHMYVDTLDDQRPPYFLDPNESNPPALPSGEDGTTISASSTSVSVGQVTNSSGQTLVAPDGTQNLDPKTWIPGASLLNVISDTAKAGPQEALLPTGSYRVSVTTSHSLTPTYAIMGDGIEGSVTAPASAHVTDTLTLDGANSQIGFVNGGHSSTPLSIQIAGGPGTADGVSATTTADPSGGASVSLHGGAVTLSATGHSDSVSVVLSGPGAGGLPVSATFGPIHLDPGQTAALTPNSWSKLSSAELAITGHGKTTTRSLTGHAQSLAAPGRPTLGVKKGSHGIRRLTIQTRLGAPRADVQFTLVWTLRRGRKLVTSYRLTLPAGKLPSVLSRTYKTGRLRRGSYSFTGEVIAERVHGIAATARAVSASRRFRIR
jgi:Bacterial Ig-like domain (group 3)/FG-GAP repeat